MPGSRASTKTIKRSARAGPGPAAGRWLILAHQLPATPSNLRVRIWRRLQALGAVAVKQAVYALPDTAESREDFEWLRVEIEGSGGEASVVSADYLDPADEAALVDEFRKAHQRSYAQLAAALQQANHAVRSRHQAAGRRRLVARVRRRLAALERLDFFSSAGRDRVVVLLASLDADSPATATAKRASSGAEVPLYQRRLWVTRPRPGVDRMASAWLIRRFIDLHARFGFIADVKAAPESAVPFDMFGSGFGHEAGRCTFETLCGRFAIREPAVVRVGEIVHDLDLKDDKFGAPEAVTLGAVIDGLRLGCGDDHLLLERGMLLFEALYRSFSRASQPPRPRAAAGIRKSARPK